MTDTTALLEALVAIPSLSRQETPAADFVEGVLRAAGVPVRRMGDNVVAWVGADPFAESSPQVRVLLLNSHLDVVPPSSHHPYPPFEPTRVESDAGTLLYGRGAVDAKGCGAAMLAAILDLHAEGAAERFAEAGASLMLALTVCEETGGADNGLEAIRPSLPPLAGALVGEPTELRPCLAQKGLLILRCTARGRSAHAARAHLGDNAILKAARDLQRVAEFQFERADPFLGAPTAVPTVIEGGDARNKVPDACTFWLDIRSVPAYTHPELTALFAGALESEVAIHSERIVPVSTPAGAPVARAVVAALEASGLDAEPFGSPTASDWMFLADVPTVKIGPGRSELSHTSEEHVPLAEVARAAVVYADVARRFFAG